MVKVIPQLDALIKDKPEDTLFWGPITQMPKDFSDADKKRLTDAYRTMIADQLMPAYKKLRAFINDEYLPKTRDTVGLDKLPNGAAWYAFNAKQSTTTDLTPAQIHQIGLDEVARIHGEIQKVMDAGRLQGLDAGLLQVHADRPALQLQGRGGAAEVLPRARSEDQPEDPRAVLADPEVAVRDPSGRAVPRASPRPAASTMTPSEDGTRPGIFYVNTYDLPTRKTWDAEDLYLHEAIPGHHFQLALQQELKNLPAFRRFGGESAFAEGWGLYAESLGKDLGVYTDPYNYFGYLQNELWRAIRLVTDTGLHSKGWTREQVIKYMLDNSAESETQATAEAERYIAWPGQALAYKIGELKIKELRAKAEKELGAEVRHPRVPRRSAEGRRGAAGRAGSARSTAGSRPRRADSPARSDRADWSRVRNGRAGRSGRFVLVARRPGEEKRPHGLPAQPTALHVRSDRPARSGGPAPSFGPVPRTRIQQDRAESGTGPGGPPSRLALDSAGLIFALPAPVRLPLLHA